MRVWVGAVAGLAVTLGLAWPTMAGEAKVGMLTVQQAWARTTIPGRPVAAYFSVMNMGTAADRLIAVSSPKAGRAELHTHKMDGGVARMRPLDAIAVPAGGRIVLRSGGDHVMLFDLDPAVKPGAMLPLTLTFEQAGAVTVQIEVLSMRDAMARDKAAGHTGHGGGHGGGHKMNMTPKK